MLTNFIIAGLVYLIVLIFLVRKTRLKEKTTSSYLLAGGNIGFVIGLLVPGWYGYHITWSEFAYKEIVPILLILFSMPFCLTGLNTRRRS